MSQKEIAKQALAALAQKGAAEAVQATAATPAAPTAAIPVTGEVAGPVLETVEVPASIAAPVAPAGIATVPAPAQPTAIEQIVPQAPQPQLTSMGYAKPELPVKTKAGYVMPQSGPIKPVVPLSPEQQKSVAGYVTPQANPLPALNLNAVSQAPETQPTQADILAQYEAMTAPLRQQRAQALALDKIDEERRNLEKRAEERDADLKQKFADIDARVRQKSLGEVFKTGSTGEKIGMSLAVLVGGIAQGLLGQKSNPVVDFLNQAAEQQAVRDKLGVEEKEMLRRQVFEQGQLELQKLENMTQNAFRKDQIRLQREQLAAQEREISARMMEKLAAQQMSAGKWSGRALTPEQLASLTDEQQRNKVILKDGRAFLLGSYEDAQKFKETQIAITDAVDAVNQLKEYTNKPLSRLSLEDRARVTSLRTKIVGALRLPYTGPGVLTDNEREALANAIGNPTGLFSLPNVERAKLEQVEKDLQANLQNTASSRGIRESVTPRQFYNVNGYAVDEDELVQAYRERMPDMSDDKIRQAIRKKIRSL